MKKLKKKLPLVLVALGLLFFGLYQYFKNYVDPGIFDNDYQYTRVYNYKAEKIKPKKAKVKEINLEFIYYEKSVVPQGLTWSEETRSDLGLFNGGDVILHATLEDGSKIRIPLEKTIRMGPNFSRKLLYDKKLEQEMLRRFPNVITEKNSGLKIAFLAGMMYVGDTLYQVPEIEAVTRFDLKNPKNGKLQTYYEYGNLPEKTNTPVFLKTKKDVNQADMQSFYDDYHNSWKGYWDRGADTISKELSNTYQYKFYYDTWYYSDSLSNLPININPTGSKFKLTVTRTQLIKRYQNDRMKVRTTQKIYTENNKEEYEKEVLNELRNYYDDSERARKKIFRK
ncbi:hypothetical protein DF218_03420 [Streptococcus parasanguinis]|uniref:hypothetical protein n=1 Tax=Streptococcus parasanguinis TaxID=1318 RepID=UPI001010540F|nr:hypothetical protein [Streptococcus parasanguinis]RXX19329.1 hypothetical protein DF218_03420 [Streptococcus parasanguinis]